MKRKLLLIMLYLGILILPAIAQKEVRQQLNKGNSSFKKEDYTVAEIDYRKALALNPTDKQGRYNLANTLLRTKRGEEAGRLYQELLKEQVLMEPTEVADVAHNAGNLMMSTQQYEQAIAYYKESLRIRPSDNETRYNLALAQKLLEQQKQEGGGGDNQEQEQQQPQDQKQDQDQKQNEQEQEDNQQPQSQQQNEMSQENAEQILNAFLKNEKKTQEKIEQQKMEQQKGKAPRRKNW